MSNTLTQTEASAVPVASKAPSTFSSCDTARVVSRKLNKAGFARFKESSIQAPGTDGYWVHKVGCLVEIDYMGYQAKLRHADLKHRQWLAITFLRSIGYNVNDLGHIQCEVSW
jgi:hypothetical protein